MVERVFPEPQFRTFYPLDDMASRAISSLSLEAAASSNGNGTNTPITSQTITYVPVDKPPTPAPSPRPNSAVLSSVNSTAGDPAHLSRLEFAGLLSAGPTARQQYLASLLRDCTPAELLFVSTTIAPLLKRDFLYELPTELALHILSFVDDPKSLASASLVSRFWNKLVRDEATWKRMCELCRFDVDEGVQEAGDGPDSGNKYAKIWVKMSDVPPGGMPLPSQTKQKSVMPTFSYKRHFEKSFITSMFR
jgi:F-box and WD-40 domain protein CDC4